MARVRRGDRVLVECATGGVGVIAIQMAKWAGAEVTGLTTSPHKKAFIESLGATAYTVDEFRRSSLSGYDFILNASGGSNVTWQRKRLGLTGRMVCIGLASAMNQGKRDFVRLALAAIRTPRISVFKLLEETTGIFGLNALTVLRDPVWVERLTRSMSTIESMNLSPHIGKVFPATDVASAHAFLETKQATGKVLLAW
jgi:NADPH2:quinone reductase